MVATATKLKFQILESELEALLIEAELIRLHQPEFNTLLKDDKTPLYIHITAENFSRVLTLRKRDLDHQQLTGTILGPFPSANKVREVLKIARKIFPWCNQAGNKTQAQLQDHQACFYQHLQLCPGACIGQISAKEYHAQINDLILFLKGKKKTVLKKLKQQLKTLSDQESYEQAAIIRDRIALIQEVTQQHYRLQPTLILPKLAAEHDQTLLQLRKILSTYLKIPKDYQLNRIEGYDVSNTSGKLASVSMVCFINGQPSPENYRLFNIKTLDTPNDYHMLKEAIARRQNNSEWGKPDLMVIDGGKGQLRAALSVWQWPAPIISIAKNPDRIILPAQITRQPRLHIQYQIVKLPSNHPVLHLIQHVRDESHRFSKQQHSRRRTKQMFK